MEQETIKQSVEQLNTRSKVRWACRRGMLELDVLFMPFVDDKAYDALDDKHQAIFRRLLTCDDPDLFAWIMGHQECKDPELKAMIEIILNRVRV